jgi:Type IV secretion-system coupling protein DNA-binding domain
MNQTAPEAPTSPLSLSLRPDLCYFGTASVRGQTKTFGILKDDRRRHVYILGKTGMGKTTLLENMILQDIYNGYGTCVMDPHGDLAEYVLDRIPAHRQNDVIYFNPSDTDFPLGFNMLEANHGEEHFLIASGMMAVFNRIWAGTWSARMEYILNNTLLALLETPGNTLLGVVRMLTDKDFRNYIVGNVKDPMVRNFWVKEFASFNDKYRTEAIAPVLNKIGQFFSSDLIRNILGQEKSTFDLRDIMDNKKILIVNLSKGRLGEDNSSLLGSLLITKIQLAAMSRVDIPNEEDRNDFYLYVDEFQNFTTDSFATILSEARKYRLSLILAHQYISQLTESGNEKVRNAVFGNVGTMIAFRIGSDDAYRIEKEFEPVFTSQQLISLNKTQVALKLLIEGKAPAPFLANTMADIFSKVGGRLQIVTELSRQIYGKPKVEVKKTINDWLEKEFGIEESQTSGFRESGVPGNYKPSGNSNYSSGQSGYSGNQNYSRNSGGYNNVDRQNYNNNQNRDNSGQNTPREFKPRNYRENASDNQQNNNFVQRPENNSEEFKPRKKKFNPYLDGGTRENNSNNSPIKTNKSEFIQNNSEKLVVKNDSLKVQDINNQSSSVTSPIKNINLVGKLSALKNARQQVEAKHEAKSFNYSKEYNISNDESFELPK